MNIEELGKTAISEEASAGQDVAYEPEFEELQQEIDKLSIATAGSSEVDWSKVENLAVTILAEKSKHLLVTVYLVKALMQRRELDGFIDGTQVLKDMIAHFWDDLYPPPKRKKGRINALQWWYDQTDGFFQQFAPQPLPEEKITAVKDLLGELDSLLEEKLADDAPMLRPLLQHVDRLPVAISKSEEPSGSDAGVAQSSASPAAESKPADSGQMPEMPDSLASDKDANRIFKAVFSQMNLVASYYREQDLANPLSYRLNRLIAWLTVDELPLIQEDGNTPLPPPEGAIRSGIENQMAAGNYESVITTAEAHVRQSLFWFDLSRFTAQALESLGEKYRKACDMVGAETSLLLQRLPGIEKLAFSDGTPFADNETQAWLKALNPAEESETAFTGGAEGSVEAGVKEAEGQARDLLKKKEKNEAVAFIQERMVSAGSCREEFLYRMAMARLFMFMGKNELAGPHLEEVLSDIKDYSLERWDPDLAIQGLLLVHENALAEKNKEKEGDILNRIVKINPAAAFRMAGK